ncbi:iron chelate uptake ABC transporter family permease subunit, partial [Photobacterium sp. BZF1]|uniref:iron chelate uptake ABC transporter family permease subunit n=1 Tax=Photobacterium sp. BZF1 TaxID=1904457 RepID=UPI001653C679
MHNKKLLWAVVALFPLAAFSLFIGVANISLESFLAGDEHTLSILFGSRLPRLLAICLAGAGLSVAGLIMQQVCQNRFAAPSTTGTIDCAMLGYVLGIVFFAGANRWVSLGVILTFALVGTLVFVQFLQRLQFKNAVLVPLIGIMYGNVISAMTTFIAYRYDLVQTMSAWTVANFASVLQGNYEFLYL